MTRAMTRTMTRANPSMWSRPLLCAFSCLILAAQPNPESRLRTILQAKTGAVTLPGGVIEISREIILPSDAHDLEIRGAETTIKATAAFRGRALIVIPAGKNIRIH